MDEWKNTAMEFHDSEVSNIDVSANTVAVKFSAAYIHRSKGRPGIDAGSGYVQALELLCTSAKMLVRDQGCIGSISDGALFIDDAKMNIVPIPFENSGKAMLEIVFRNGSRFCVASHGVAIQLTGEQEFVENFKC
jgi:hypothetical protein